MKTRIVGVLLIGAVALLALSTEALAAEITYISHWGGTGATGAYGDNAAISGVVGSGGGGLFTLEVENGGQFQAFCIELTQFAPTGDYFTYNSVTSAAAPNTNNAYNAMGTAGEDALDLLFGTAFFANNGGMDGVLDDLGATPYSWTKAEAYGFQLAIWEIVYEYADAAHFGGSLGLADGNFTLTGDSVFFLSAAGYAATALSDMGDAFYADTHALTNSIKQDYVLVEHENSPAPPAVVPLPPAALGGLFLLGGLAAARRRRKNLSE